MIDDEINDDRREAITMGWTVCRKPLLDKSHHPTPHTLVPSPHPLQLVSSLLVGWRERLKGT